MACHFYPRSPCGERQLSITVFKLPVEISIHALLAESDMRVSMYNVSPPRFLSTLSLRRATYSVFQGFDSGKFLSTLSLRRATHLRRNSENCPTISIHALLAESDGLNARILCSDINFYPRSPCGERHTWQRGSRITYVISIHALLAESDTVMVGLLMFSLYFYPRSPCGERRAWMGGLSCNGYFYPRSPCGERRWSNRPVTMHT